MNHLSTLPPEVMEHALFPFLKWNDLLRLRRVSTTSKVLVDGYVKVNPELAPEIEIGGKETERNLRAFLDLALPSTKVFLNNCRSENEFYQENSEELSEFLEVYGSVVTHLRVERFSLYCSGMERTFLEGLVNLQDFTAVWFDTEKVAGADVLPVPGVFGNVTVLKLLHYDHGDFRDNYDRDCVNGTIELLTACRMLNAVQPLNINSEDEDDNSLNTKLFRFLDAAIRQREDNPEGAFLSHLEAIDLDNDMMWTENIWDWEDEDRTRAENDYRQFLRTCAVHGIKLQNVEVCQVLIDFAKNRGHLLLPFESLSVPSSEPYNWIWVTKTEMPILKHLVVRTCGVEFDEDEVEDMGTIDDERVKSCSDNWPMLTKLELTLELPRMASDKDTARLILRETRDLFLMFFQGVCYQALTELTLNFYGEVGNDILTAESLTSSCSNLTKLKLVNWGGNNKQFIRLWEGLPNLEVVVLDHCSSLGDDGFIGPDAQNPAFLKLKKLKNLSLLQLYSMPGITDNLFSTVIRHLSLTHFDISSCMPHKNVTNKGIKSLLGGRFEETIQKFPFKDWSLGLFNWIFGEPMRNLQKLFAHRLENMF